MSRRGKAAAEFDSFPSHGVLSLLNEKTSGFGEKRHKYGWGPKTGVWLGQEAGLSGQASALGKRIDNEGERISYDGRALLGDQRRKSKSSRDE